MRQRRFPQSTKGPVRAPVLLNEKRKRACKPGSVIDGHLSGTCVAARLKPPPWDGRAGLMSLHGVAPDRVYSTGLSPADGRALISAFPPSPGMRPAVYLCCTCPRVAPGGCYPLSLPCGARTFLTCWLSPHMRGRPARSTPHCNRKPRLSQPPGPAFSQAASARRKRAWIPARQEAPRLWCPRARPRAGRGRYIPPPRTAAPASRQARP